jgi:hypothetical protein
MEVHHHPHVEKKNFKEYFLEFLMIFLAVTLGFFAEQTREHFADKAKEKEYMREIVENLKYDTIRCSINSQKNIQAITGLDSFRTELKNAIGGTINANRLYYFNRYTSEINRAVFNKSAITELKNSGSLRLLGDKKIVLELSDYYERKVTAAEAYLPSKAPLNVYETEFFSLLYLDDIIQAYDSIQTSSYRIRYDYQNILHHQPVLHLLDNNATQLKRFYTTVAGFEIQLKQYIFWLLYCKTAAEKLITDIQKEYHLEN